MKTGPVPQPTALKLLRGNPSKRALNKREPKYESGIPDQPTLDADEKAVWQELVEQLSPSGVLTKADKFALELASCLIVRWRNLSTLAKADPENKHVSIQLKDATVQVRNILSELGLTPASRSRVQVPQQPATTEGNSWRDALDQ